MTLAPSYSPTIPFPSRPEPIAPTATALALSLESAVVDVAELVDLAARLDSHAAREGESVSARSIVAKAFLVASLRHPAIDARWPLLPARHGVRLSELTAALDPTDYRPDAATAIPDDAAVLSVSGIVERDGAATLELRLAFDPRRSDALEAHRFVQDLAALLTDPWELVASC